MSRQKPARMDKPSRRRQARQILLEEVSPAECEPPTQSELQLYALNELGIDLDKEPELTALALEGLTSRLPRGWRAVQLLLESSDEAAADSESGSWVYYYYNSGTGESTWEHPNNARFRRKAAKERRRLQRKQSAAALPSNTNADDAVDSSCRVKQFFRRRRPLISSDLAAAVSKTDTTCRTHQENVEGQESARDQQSLHRRCSTNQSDLERSRPVGLNDLRKQLRASVSTTSSAAMDSVDSGIVSDLVEPSREHRPEPAKRLTQANELHAGDKNQPANSKLPRSPALDWSRVASTRCNPTVIEAGSHAHTSSAAADQLPPSGCRPNRRCIGAASKRC